MVVLRGMGGLRGPLTACEHSGMAKKNPHAVALGRLGGKAPGAPKGFAALTPGEAKAAAQRAAAARGGRGGGGRGGAVRARGAPRGGAKARSSKGGGGAVGNEAEKGRLKCLNDF